MAVEGLEVVLVADLTPGFPDSVAAATAALTLFAAIAVPIGIWFFRWGRNRALREGSLSKF